MSAFDVETISLPLTSKLPPNCGEVSSTRLAINPVLIISGLVPSLAVA